MRSLAIALMIAAAPAFAGQRMLEGNAGTVLRLYDTPCLHGGTLGHLKPEWRPKFQRAEFTKGHDRVFACWIDTEEGVIYIQIEDGQSIEVPITSFKDEGL